MKSFQFQQFEILQDQDVFRVGTDGVLLGALSSVELAQNVLEVGTGTGLISLMLAQRNPNAKVLAIDINEKAVALAKINFDKSPFSDRLKVENQDFKCFQSNKKFDLIISNPPYFENNASQKDILARQQVELNFLQLIEKASEHLVEDGVFSVIIPKNSEDFFVKKCESHNLYLLRKIDIKGNENVEVKRCVLEFGFKYKSLVFTELILEKAPRVYSEEYLRLTKDFHIFK